MKAVRWPDDSKPFQHLPTFDALAARTGVKVAKLRQLLADVPCWKCADNSVRYDESAAMEALDGVDPYKEELDDAAAAAVSEPLPTDAVQAALAVMNRTLALFSVVIKERGDIVQTCCQALKAMVEPQKIANQLVTENQGLMRERLKHYDDQQLDLMLLIEELHSRKGDREQRQAQQAERAAYRKETFELAKKYVPDALDKFKLTTEASLALRLARAVDPQAIEAVIEMGGLPEDAKPDALKLVEHLKRQRAERDRAAAAAAERRQKESSSNGSAEPAPTASATPTPTPEPAAASAGP